MNKTPQASVTVARSAAYAGPIPLASQMAEYAKVSPDFPERIMRMAEREQEAQLKELDRESIRKDDSLKLAFEESKRSDEILSTNRKTTFLGMAMAFLLTLALFAVVAICAIYNHPWASSILGTGGLAAITFIYIMGSKEKKQ